MSDSRTLARRIADTMLKGEGTGPNFGIRVEDADVGYSKISMTVRDDMLNSHMIASSMLFNLPNLLTLSRIVALPLLAFLLWWPDWAFGYLMAFVLYCVMGFTDYFDGYLARSRNQVSVAQSASIVFTSPVKNGERLEAEAREIALMGRSGVYAITVRGGDGRVVAQFQGQSRTISGTIVEE